VAPSSGTRWARPPSAARVDARRPAGAPRSDHRVTASRLDRWRRFAADRLDPKVYLGLHVTVSFVVCALAVWLFAALVDAVLESDSIVNFDIAAAAWIHARVTPSGLRAFQVITDIGSPAFVSVLVVAMAIWGWRRRERVLAIGVVIISAGEALLDVVLKAVIHRNRPEFAVRFLHRQSFSFPSGHAFGSMVVYGLLAYLLMTFYRPAHRARKVILAGIAALILSIGVSRVYLGVHYPSDVIGGFAAGIAWLSICLTGIRLARERSSRPDAAKSVRAGA
jgi:membrane-associated phospholipid phosphatase